MKAKIVPSVKNGIIAYPAILSLVLYVFCYQFAYPFSSTFFLYIAFAGLVVWLFFGQKIYLSKVTVRNFLKLHEGGVSHLYRQSGERKQRGNSYCRDVCFPHCACTRQHFAWQTEENRLRMFFCRSVRRDVSISVQRCGQQPFGQSASGGLL